MSGVVAKAGKEAARYTLRDGLKAAGKLAAFRDGNIAEQELNHGPGGVHVGTDANGNRFFENLDAQIGRHRWVVFAGHDWRNGGSSITPEWHGWMHAICDESPANAAFAKPAYALRAAANPTSTPGRVFSRVLGRPFEAENMWRPIDQRTARSLPTPPPKIQLQALQAQGLVGESAPADVGKVRGVDAARAGEAVTRRLVVAGDGGVY
jgi:NADH:ubiquinone oxidoreductase subunit